MTRRKRANSVTPAASAAIELDPPPWALWMTQAAFVLTLVLVAARAMMSEPVREAMDVTAGSLAAPAAPGPASTLALNALCCLPALLVLVRRVVDPTYALRLRGSHVLLALLAAWAACSVAWSTDRFVTVVSASSTFAAAVLVWSTAQLVRSWLRLRIVAGVCVGLLLIYATQGLIYRYVEHEENVRFWQDHRQQILAERGWQEDSFTARQFERKLLAGEMLGFHQSPNSFAAVIVLVIVISGGIAIQRRASADALGWSLFILLAFLPALLVLYHTGTRTAMGTLMIAAALLASLAVARWRNWLATHSRLAYAGGAAIVLLGAVALVAHGIHHGSLPHDSLTFRWRYWLAAFDLWTHYPVTGVGWGNFGPHYLAFRLPIAAEEVRDPHNFLVRGFAELGTIGGLLIVAWLARAAWEVTRPIAPPASGTSTRSAGIATVAVIALGGPLFNALIAIDWSQEGAYLTFEIFRRLLASGLLCLGLIVATVRGRQEIELDARPASWLLRAMVAALGVFMIHAMLDFVLSEPGPLTLFAVLLGATLGVRSPPTAGSHKERTVAIAALTIGGIAWFIASFAIALPVASAEEQARRGDEALRVGRPDLAAGFFRSAYDTVPYNADYAFRAARALLIAGAPAEQVNAMLATAIATDPVNVAFHLTRAAVELRSPTPDAQAIRADFGRALQIDPYNVDARLDHAAALEKLGDPAAAAQEYRDALRRNDLLHPDEPKRLQPERIGQIEERIRQLTDGGGAENAGPSA